MVTLTAPVTRACQDIANDLPGRVFYPRSSKYKSELKQYWSKALRDLKPACVIAPTTAAEVSTIIQILNKYPDVNFAVKSGGHSPNPGHASVNGGILIALRQMTGATYDKATGWAYVKPGGTWNDVIKVLEPSGVTVVGGRLGSVGVGGYLLQGGLSFLSGQYGLAADSIVGWETIMPNGSIVNVDAATQPDVAVAMRGSGSQFGIVTQFKIRAHPIGQVWGGLRFYSNSSRDTLFSALHKFTSEGAQDPKAAIILSNLVAGSKHAFIIHYFYDGATPPTTGPFADFLKIPSFNDQTKRWKYSELLKFTGLAPTIISGRSSFRSFTIPYVASNPGMYHEISSKWSEITSSHLKPIQRTRSVCSVISSHLKSIQRARSFCSVTFQPFPSHIAKHSQDAGGNAMGISSSDPDRLILELQCMWYSKNDDEVLRGMGKEMTAWLENMMPNWLAEAGADNYMPYFMNDAAEDQKVMESYRDYEKLKSLQMQIDSDKLFRTRLGGFKY